MPTTTLRNFKIIISNMFFRFAETKNFELRRTLLIRELADKLDCGSVVFYFDAFKCFGYGKNLATDPQLMKNSPPKLFYPQYALLLSL